MDDFALRAIYRGTLLATLRASVVPNACTCPPGSCYGLDPARRHLVRSMACRQDDEEVRRNIVRARCNIAQVLGEIGISPRMAGLCDCEHGQCIAYGGATEGCRRG